MIVPRGALPDVAAVAAHYDELDDFYRALWGTHLHHGYWLSRRESPEQAVINLTRLVSAYAAMKPGDRVCDLGCGYGAAALMWQREHGVTVTGVTISEKQFAYATSAARAIPDVQFRQADACDTGLPSASVDIVTAIESSEHMADKMVFFSEAYRLLRAGGRCVVAAWLTRENPSTRETKYLLDPICSEGRLPSMASAAEYYALLQNSGFADIAFVDFTARVKKTWTFVAARLVRRFLSDAAFRRFLADPEFSNRIFVKAVFRIWLAYRIGAMRFGLFCAYK
jgi:tocopherol O-methyltransferase